MIVDRPTNVKSCLVEHITERGALYENRAVTRAPDKPYVVLSNQQAVPSGTRAVCRGGRLVNLPRVWLEVRRFLHPCGRLCPLHGGIWQVVLDESDTCWASSIWEESLRHLVASLRFRQQTRTIR